MRKPYKPVSARQKKKIIDAISATDASRKTGVSVSYCWILRDRAGVPRARRPYTKQELRTIKSLYRKETIVSIAQKLDRSHSSVFRKIRDLRMKGWFDDL